MDKNTYLRIYESVNDPENIEDLAIKFNEPAGVIAAILNQKIVSKVKRKMHSLQSKSRNYLYLWNKGVSIVVLAKNNEVPATLMASVIIKELGYSKKYVLKHLDSLEDRRLAREITEAINEDHFFSPEAHRTQSVRGQMGEEIIEKWLVYKELEFSTEEDLRDMGMQKTPDFLLDKPIYVDDVEILWIESKAMFGDEKEHAHYLKKQFQYYQRDYGTGMVIYWYGHIDGLAMEGNVIRDHNFYRGSTREINTEIEKLLNLSL
ncbi:C15orf41 family protein [Methanococcoides sp. LMO-2]|uniref:C15orf41 family protein n=1 Tax=Methanococcoides cohabitans TaxID=3136559 RepID=A0ABU9KWB1_9EURY